LRVFVKKTQMTGLWSLRFTIQGRKSDEESVWQERRNWIVIIDDFLKEDGIYESVTLRAMERVLVRRSDQLMRREEISKKATDIASRKEHGS
jgi:hypothetical protein